MDLQQACDIVEELLEKDAYANHNKLSMKQFVAINSILLELQSTGKHVYKGHREVKGCDAK